MVIAKPFWVQIQDDDPITPAERKALSQLLVVLGAVDHLEAMGVLPVDPKQGGRGVLEGIMLEYRKLVVTIPRAPVPAAHPVTEL